MQITRRAAAAGLLSAAAVPQLAKAQARAPRLFTDSRLVEKDRIGVEVAGQGPDLVFIPGSVSSREVWKATAERLKPRYRLHLVQIAGFGGEPARANAKGPAWEPTAEAIDSYVVEAGISPAAVIGHSLGGTMALYLAQKHPDHYRKAMLVDATPLLAETFGMPPAAITGMKATVAAGQVRPMTMTDIEPGLPNLIGPSGRDMILASARASDPVASGWLYVENMVVDLRPGLKTTRTPITIVFPDNAPLGAPAGATRGVYERSYADLATKTLVEVKDARHFVMQDQPEAFSRALDAFLAS